MGSRTVEAQISSWPARRLPPLPTPARSSKTSSRPQTESQSPSDGARTAGSPRSSEDLDGSIPSPRFGTNSSEWRPSPSVASETARVRSQAVLSSGRFETRAPPGGSGSTSMRKYRSREFSLRAFGDGDVTLAPSCRTRRRAFTAGDVPAVVLDGGRLDNRHVSPIDDLHAEQGHEHGSELSETQIRVRALESVLVEKGYVDPAALDLLIETYETRVGPHNGARVIAKAWTDGDYRRWLLADGGAAVASLGYAGRQGENLVVLENTRQVHNLVVCTLCSCYPWPVLGLPPVWYKSAPYRSRAVADPRGVLRDFGVELAPEVQIRVWDSTAELRYLVVPMQPAGTDGWTKEDLAGLVTRDSMIGTGLPKQPQELVG
jgi:nitrile hydratase